MTESGYETYLYFEELLQESKRLEHEAKEVGAAAARAAAELQRQNDAFARAAKKRQEEIEKSSRRRDRAEKHRIRNTMQWAACGIRLYNRNAYSGQGWTHCHHCGAALRYFDLIGDAQEDAKNRECKRA